MGITALAKMTVSEYLRGFKQPSTRKRNRNQPQNLLREAESSCCFLFFFPSLDFSVSCVTPTM